MKHKYLEPAQYIIQWQNGQHQNIPGTGYGNDRIDALSEVVSRARIDIEDLLVKFFEKGFERTVWKLRKFTPHSAVWKNEKFSLILFDKNFVKVTFLLMKIILKS